MKFSTSCTHVSISSICLGCMSENVHVIYIYVSCWVFMHVWCVRRLCGSPCQMEGSWAAIQNSSFRNIWFRVHSNNPPFTLVRLSPNLAPSNRNWQTGFRCKYKCHCNYGGKKSANKQRVRVYASV